MWNVVLWFSNLFGYRSGLIATWSDDFIRLHVGKSASAPCRLSTGVPQGLVLGLLLFFSYTCFLSNVISSLDFSCHSCVDNTQAIFSLLPSNLISAYQADTSSWMTAHHLKLNPSKTKLLFMPGPLNDHIISFEKRCEICQLHESQDQWQPFFILIQPNVFYCTYAMSTKLLYEIPCNSTLLLNAIKVSVNINVPVIASLKNYWGTI